MNRRLIDDVRRRRMSVSPMASDSPRRLIDDAGMSGAQAIESILQTRQAAEVNLSWEEGGEMRRMPPRLISDVRRRRLIGGVALAVAAGATLLVGDLAFCRFRDNLRSEALQELAKAEERLARIDEISSAAFSRYCGDWTNLVERTSGRLQEPGRWQTEVRFLSLSRSHDYQGEVIRLTNEYSVARQRLDNARNDFSAMIDRGRSVAVRMDGVSRNAEDQGFKDVSSALFLFCNSLRGKMNSLIELCGQRTDWRDVADRIDDKWDAAVVQDEWKSRSSLLAEYQQLTNELHKIARSYSSVSDDVARIVGELADVPFDDIRSVDAIRTILAAKLDEYEECWNEAVEMLEHQEKALLKCQAESVETMEKGAAELDELHRQHGSYVNAECCKEIRALEDESLRLKLSSALRMGTPFQSVSNELVRLEAVRMEIISATNTLTQIDGGKDKMAEDICQRGMALAQKMDFSNLRSGVKAGCDAAQETIERIGVLGKRFTGILGRIKTSLPDWGQLAVKMADERKSLAAESRKINEELESVLKALGECRSEDEKIMNSLNAACYKVVEALRVAGASCAEQVVCTNGVSAERSIQINEKIKCALDLLREKMTSLKEETNKRLADASLYRVGYRRDPLLLQNDVVTGARKAEFAVDVERAGSHRIAIRIEKRRGNYLFRSSGRHDVKIQGTLSDGCGGLGSGEKSVTDSTANWRQFELVALESKCTEGKNSFNLKLEFHSEGHGVETGEWRLDLLEFEVWIDGKKEENVYRLVRL